MIRVLVVEDSAVVREFLTYVLSMDRDLEIAGTATNGEEAIEAVKLLKPDVITMDIHMPKMDGFEATRRIMEVQPTPIVVVSGSSTVKEIAVTFHALEVGALALVPRPKGIGDVEFETTARELIRTVKLMSEVKVVRRWNRSKKELPTPSAPTTRISRNTSEIQVVAIGSSTGGPLALQAILSVLSKNFPVPLLIVQHMATGFIQGFVEWLAESTSFQVSIATDFEQLLPGHAYVAPDGLHLAVRTGNCVMLGKGEFENGLRPSVAYLFRSVAETFGKNAVGVLLTGMGRDGARELKLMRDKGAITIAQDLESSVVYGMPGEAVKLDAATYVLPLDRIAPALNTLLNMR